VDDYVLIKEVFERDINKKVLSIVRYENLMHNINKVFKVEIEDQSYIFKMYHAMGYPEEDKMMFVSNKLDEHRILHAKICFYNRNDKDVSNGYIIEECLPGITADRLALTEQEICNIYKKLAILTSEIHKIKFEKYGFIVCGVPDCNTFTEHIENEFIYGNNKIQYAYTSEKLDQIKRTLVEKLKPCDKMQPCLCHIDISLKNMLIDNDNLTLIDWDDARSFPAIVDIARLTLLIELAYDNEKAEDIKKAGVYKKAFIDHYKSDDGFKRYNELESALHAWHGLVMLNFCNRDKPQFGKIKAMVDEKLKLIER